MSASITLRGVRVHNLRNISLDIPHRRLVVITGVSGSGKSSLAFDTLYAEGQRRYVESFSAYARQFLERMDKPDVDHVAGILPAVAIERKNPIQNRRSTVGTATEINDFLRLLFARVGKTHCERCGREVAADTVDRVVDKVLALPQGTRFIVAFPIGKVEGAVEDTLLRLTQQGFVRRMLGSEVADIAQKPRLPRKALAKALVVVDRLTVKPDIRERLADSVATAFQNGGGQVVIQVAQASSLQGSTRRACETHHAPSACDGKAVRSTHPTSSGQELPDFVGAERVRTRQPKGCTPECYLHRASSPPRRAARDACATTLRFSTHFQCAHCDLEYAKPEPLLFSFNNPLGACPVCQGFGHTIELDMDAVIPDKSKTLDEGAVAPWNCGVFKWWLNELRQFAPRYRIRLDVPFRDLTERERKLVVEGTSEMDGIRGFMRWLEDRKYKMHIRVFLSRYRGYVPCAACKGARLKPAALSVRVAGLNIAQVCAQTAQDALAFFDALKLAPHETQIASLLVAEIRKRLDYMVRVGLGYLSLDRMCRTLSGGEMQRVCLTTALGSSLVNTLYVLDEPTIGLHPRDTHRLVDSLKRLRDLGNTVVVVEHDRDMMKASDQLIDLGPGAGEHGGRIVYQGPFSRIPAANGSLTGRYLRGTLRIEPPTTRRRPSRQALVLKGARENNLKNIDVTIPLGLFVCVTGVSGSGKSSLVQDTLFGAVKRKKRQFGFHAGKHRSLSGTGHISDAVLVDQSPIGRTPRSNPVTYVKAFSAIRDLFASTPAARRRGWKPGHFSFNVPGGRCERCEGHGHVKIDMQFLADVFVTCEACEGRRYQRDVLDVRYRGASIQDVLDMTVSQAMDFFRDAPKVTRGLKPLVDTGLGYIRLGQPATTLSGGEAQRLKLAAYLTVASGRNRKPPAGSKPAGGSLLFLFDEPTTGLHFDDIAKLLGCFRALLDAGHSLVVIEHNLDVIKCADYVIDLGPEGGDYGGRVVARGTPEQVSANPQSHTGRHLKAVLS